MNQYRCIVVECCGKCIHSAYRSPTERFCNREKPYWTLRLDQWADGISSCCTLPTHTDFQSEMEKVLDKLDKEIHIREDEMNRKAGLEENLVTASGYYASAGALNWVRKVLIDGSRADIRQAGE